MSASCDKGSEGCIDSNACNYDNTVAIDDGSCWSANEGCRCEHPFNSIADCLGVCDTDDENNPPDDNGDGICNEDVIGGCIDSTKYQNKYLCNYSPNATHNNDSCAVDLSQFGGDLNGNDCTYPLGGSCGGSAVMDECDLCIGGTTNYGKCWKIKIKSIATFKLKNGFPMGSDTSSITIGASKYALDGYNETVTDDGNTDCEENYNDVPGLLKTEMNSDSVLLKSFVKTFKSSHSFFDSLGPPNSKTL